MPSDKNLATPSGEAGPANLDARGAPASSRGAADARIVEFPGIAIDPSRGATSPVLDVKAEQIRITNRHPSLILVNLINALLVVAVLWRVFPQPLLLAWYALFVVVIPARLFLVRLSKLHGWPTDHTGSLAVLGSALTGAIWGLLAWPIVVIPGLAYSVFIAFVLGGMTAGALLLDAAYLPAFGAFVAPIVAPVTIAFLLRDDEMTLAMGGMLAAFAFAQAVVGYRTNRWIVETLRLQAQRETLTAELTRREAILRVIASQDQLTGLCNRHHLRQTLARELHRARRLRQLLTVALVDIDHFKKYNDDFGHEAGDEVLRTIGAVLQAAVPGSDIACRYGGEEFVLVLLDSTAAATMPRLTAICHDIKQREYIYHGQRLPNIALSVGVAQYPDHGNSVDELIRAADHALYAARKAGRDRIEVFAT